MTRQSLSLICCASALLAADATAEPPKGKARAKEKEKATPAKVVSKAAVSALSVAGDVGFGGVGGVSFTTLQGGVDIVEGKLSLGLFARVRVVMEDQHIHGRVRQRDWDEITDYVHVLRYLRYRRQFKSFGLKAQAGDILSYSLGHGSVIRDYSNVADPDHLHAGIRFDVDNKYLDVSMMIDNFVRPSVVAGRASLRPLPMLSNLVLGGTLVLDPRAPKNVRLDQEGTRIVDEAFNLQTENTLFTVVGGDVEYTFGRPGSSFTPYFDLNGAFYGGSGYNAGIGAHLGFRAELPVGKTGVKIGGQLEYRLSGPGYAPSYFQTFYDVERYQASLTYSDPDSAPADRRGTRLAAVGRGDGGHGMLAELGLYTPQSVHIRVGFSSEPTPDANRMWIGVMSLPIDRLSAGAFVMMRGLGGPSDGAAGISVLSEARFRLTEQLYALAQYGRVWYLREESRHYGILQSLNIALGGTWSG